MMRILHVIPDLSPRFGGPARAVMEMARCQQEQGYEVRVVTTGTATQHAMQATVPVDEFEYYGPSWRWSPSLSHALRTLIGKKADIVHVHTIWHYPVLKAALEARRFGKPFVLRPCGMLDSWSMEQKALRKRLYLALAGRFLARAAYLHFTSENELKRAVTLDHRQKSFIVNLGIDVKALQDRHFQSRFWADFPHLKDTRILLFLGRLHEKKQPEVVVEVFAQLLHSHPDLTLVMAGDGIPGYVSQLRQRAMTLGIEPRVLFTGWLDKAHAIGVLQSATLLMLPSRQENFGLTVVEAMAAGCAIVVSNEIDLAAEIEERKAGITCEPTVRANLAAAEAVLATQDMREKMTRSAKAWVVDRFDWNSACRRLTPWYREAIENAQRSGS